MKTDFKKQIAKYAEAEAEAYAAIRNRATANGETVYSIACEFGLDYIGTFDIVTACGSVESMTAAEFRRACADYVGR